MNIEYTSRLTVEGCRAFPDKIFVFGDNLDRHGRAGQAIIRYEPNAFGIPTKRFATMHIGAFFKDSPCEREHVLRALRELYTRGKNSTIVFPHDGIGTGLAQMPKRSPKLYAEMCDILQTHFGIRNGHA